MSKTLYSVPQHISNKSYDLAKLDELVFKQVADQSLCFALAILNSLLITNPSVLNEAMNQVNYSRVVNLGPIKLEIPEYLKSMARQFQKESGISYEKALLALSLADYINGERILNFTTEGRIGSYQPTSTEEVIFGGRMEWIFRACFELGNRSVYLRERLGREGFHQVLSSGKAKGALLSLVLDELTQARHLVTVLDVKDGRVYLLDCVSNGQHYFSNCFKSARPESQHVWSVDLRELCDSNRIRYMVAEKGLHIQELKSLAEIHLVEVDTGGVDDISYYLIMAKVTTKKEKSSK
jgi:hypothetical protein